MMSLISVDNLTKRYGRRTGVVGLDFNVPAGAMFGFLGPNGAGKTTTIRVLLGFLRPTGGKAGVFGLNTWRDSARIKAEVGYVPGDLRFYPWLTCKSALKIFGQVRGRDLMPAGAELSQDFDLDPDVRVRSMSRGMRQKLGLILALVHEPRLLVLDEPTASLDPLMQKKLYDHLRSLVSAGHTVFFSSHTLSEVEQLCDHVVILREGKLVADETLENLRARARRDVTIVWQDSVKLDAVTVPGFIDVYERHNRQWSASLTGSATELIRWGAQQPIEDLTIGQPDLARLFEQYYE
ncbi:MAG: ABC transporter ATP-binding protein [Phycisphaerales bacterium]|nr:MAG: ABC transporter ATP-binding protein [Phycisphaerales bacterium]